MSPLKEFKFTIPAKQINCEPDLSLDSQFTTPISSPLHPLMLWQSFWPALSVTPEQVHASKNTNFGSAGKVVPKQ